VRVALTAVHAGERHLLRSAQGYELAHLLAAVEARGQQARDAGMALISGRFAAWIAAIMDTTPQAGRAAALARLRDEQANEVAALQVINAAETRVQRRVITGTVRLQHRHSLSILAQRQRHERMGSALQWPRVKHTAQPRRRFSIDRRLPLVLRSRKTAALRRRRPKSSRRPIGRLPKDA
jgi:hypothetical protein